MTSPARPDWRLAHPYLRSYLAQHAAGAGPDILAALVRQAGFLAVADPVTLSPVLNLDMPRLGDVTRVYRRASPFLGQDPSYNAAYLEETAVAMGDSWLGYSGIRPAYRTVLALARDDGSVFCLTGHGNSVLSVAFGLTADGRLLLASGGADGACTCGTPSPASPSGNP